MNSKEWYIEFIDGEVQRLVDGRFTGNVEFQINFKDGGICNQNITLRKSVKQPQ